MYRVTGQPGETPHVWVKDPEKSVILEVIGDVRTIPTTVYATGRSLRFPRTKRIRHDKGIHDLTSLEEPGGDWLRAHDPEAEDERGARRGPRRRAGG